MRRRRGPAEDPRDALIREQAERIAALEAMVADLRVQLEAAQRAESRNSGNSSMPPSSDDLPGRKPPRKQRRAAERAEKKRRGKQPGCPGAAMRWEVADRTGDHYPEGACSCGRDLADAEDLGVTRSFQQEKIPAGPAERVQHDLHKAKCACGRVHVAPRPLEHEFRHAVLAGLASVPRVPGPKNSTKQKPGRDLLEFCKQRRDDVHSPRNTSRNPRFPSPRVNRLNVYTVRLQICGHSWRHVDQEGHWVIFIIGFFLPFFWLTGALVPSRRLAY